MLNNEPTLIPTKRRTRKEVKRLLRPRGLKSELARRAGVSLSSVSHWARHSAYRSANLDREFERLVAEKGLTL